MHADLILDPELRRQFDVDGYAVVPMLSDQDVADLLDAYRTIHSGVEMGFYTTLWSQDLKYRARVHEAIRRVLLPRLDGVLGPRQFFLSQFAVKQASESGSECPMHQDWSFLDDTKYTVVSIWCPLVDVDSENGCLAVVPGSHRATNRIRPNAPRDWYYNPFEKVLPTLCERHLREIPIKAGNAILYDGRLLHGSKPNRSAADRPAVVVATAPIDAPILHYWQNTDTTVEVFRVDEEFFWKDVQWGQRPDQRPLVGVVECPPLPAPITEEQYLTAWRAAEAESPSLSP